MDLFTLVARLGMDSSEYEKGISKARGSFSDLSSTISAKAVAFGTMTAHAIEKAADAAINLGKSAIQAAADIEAEKAQFKATFGDMQGSAEKAFNAISKSTGIMSARLQTVGTKAFSQFKGAGLDAVDALSMMEEYTTLAADAAAYYDITLEDADQRLRSFLLGNTEAGDAIGLFTSESQRNTAAMEKYGQKWTSLTEAQKQMLMLDISKEIYEQSGAIGQANRESDAWANTVANLKKAWEKALALIGEPIMVVLTPILQDVTEWLGDEETQLKLKQFGLTVGNAIDATVDFVLGIPSPTEIAAQLNNWWEEVKASLNPFSVTSQVKIQRIDEAMKTGGIGAGIKTAIDESWLNPKNWFDGSSIKTSPEGNVYESTHDGKGASFATGLDYVPYNDFAARLHEGEAVLTKLEAEAWRNGTGSGRADYASLGSVIGAAVREALNGVGVYMGAERVGDLVTERVSRNIAIRAQSRRYQPV